LRKDSPEDSLTKLRIVLESEKQKPADKMSKNENDSVAIAA